MLNYKCTEFLQSASALSNAPADVGAEVAFAGRSNAGKSSAINTLTRNSKLARTSRTPGRTQVYQQGNGPRQFYVRRRSRIQGLDYNGGNEYINRFLVSLSV